MSSKSGLRAPQTRRYPAPPASALMPPADNILAISSTIEATPMKPLAVELHQLAHLARDAANSMTKFADKVETISDMATRNRVVGAERSKNLIKNEQNLQNKKRSITALANSSKEDVSLNMRKSSGSKLRKLQVRSAAKRANFRSVSPWSKDFAKLAQYADWLITSASPWSEDWEILTNTERIKCPPRPAIEVKPRKTTFRSRYFKSCSPFDEDFPPYEAKKAETPSYRQKRFDALTIFDNIVLGKEEIQYKHSRSEYDGFESYSPFDARFPRLYTIVQNKKPKRKRVYNTTRLFNELILGMPVDGKLNRRLDRVARPINVLPIDLLDERDPESHAVIPWSPEFNTKAILAVPYITSVPPWSADWDRLTGNFNSASPAPDMEPIGWAGLELPITKHKASSSAKKTYYVAVSPFDARFPPFTATKRSLQGPKVVEFQTYSPFDSRFPRYFSPDRKPKSAMKRNQILMRRSFLEYRRDLLGLTKSGRNSQSPSPSNKSAMRSPEIKTLSLPVAAVQPAPAAIAPFPAFSPFASQFHNAAGPDRAEESNRPPGLAAILMPQRRGRKSLRMHN